MIKNDFIKITNLIKKELLENKVLKEAAIEEEKEGNLIDITSIIKQINYTQNKIIEKEPEITSTALIYSGEPLVLTHFVLETIYNNSKLDLYNSSYNIFQASLLELVKNILNDFNMKVNIQIIVDKQQQTLIQNQQNYNRIVYVGDYFNYEKLKYYIKNPITYYSYGHIKIYVDKTKDNEKYVDLIKYAYIHNIEIESYENIDDLINDLNEKEEYMIISDESKLENIKKLEKLENNKNKLIDLNEIKENYIFRLE